MAETVERSLKEVTSEEIIAHFQTDQTMTKGPTISPEIQASVVASVKILMDMKQKQLMTQVNKTARRQDSDDEKQEDSD